MEASCIILTGGRSSRLGRAKTRELVGKKNLLERVYCSISPLCKEILIVKAQEQTIPEIARHPGTRVLVDLLPGKGPLVGIYTGLSQSSYFYNLVVAADMPFLNRELLEYMFGVVDGYGLVIPRLGSRLEPLHAIYSKDCLKTLDMMINSGEWHARDISAHVNTRYVDKEEITRFDPQLLSLFNINTQADLKKARMLAKGAAFDNC